MKKNSFLEYMNSKGTIEKPKVTIDGDNVESQKIDQPKQKKPSKNSQGGFGDLGDKQLKYEPDTGKDVKKSPAKLPTVDEVSVLAHCSKILGKNASLVENFVRMLKQEKVLGPILAESFNHNETYKHVTELMSHESYGPSICNKLNRAMNEEVSSPFSDQLDGEEEEEMDDDQMMGDDDTPMDDDQMMGDDDTPMDDDQMMGDDMPMDDDQMMGDDDMPMDDDQMMVDDDMSIDDDQTMGDDEIDSSMPHQDQMPDSQEPNPMERFQKAMMKRHMRRMMNKS